MKNLFQQTTQFLSCCLGLLVLFLSLTAPLGLVLCVGHEGHVGIEAVNVKGCSDLATPATSEAISHGPVFSQKHCGKCTDIPLIASATESALSGNDFSSLDFKPIYRASLWGRNPGLFLEATSEEKIPQIMPIIDQVLKVRRTTVLLI